MKQILKNKDIILVASSNYDSLYDSKLNVHFIAEEFSQLGINILFVESLGLKDIPIYGASDWIKLFNRVIAYIKLMIFGIRREGNVYILPIIRLPFDKYKLISKLNEKIITHYIKKYSKKYLKAKPIIWSFSPIVSYLQRNIPNSLFIYQNVDDYSAIPYVDKSYVITSERRTLRTADIVFTVSKSRVEDFQEYARGEVIFLNNVGNFKLFSKAVTESNIKVPKSLENIVKLKKPIVGFVGNLAAYKEDVTLLYYIAKLATDYEFVIIGGIGEGDLLTNVSKLRRLKNTHFLGPVNYNQLYKYLKYIDIAVIPRRMNAVGQGGFPMKYFEFLSAGIPTVVTGVGGLKEFGKSAQLGGVASNPDEFLAWFEYWTELKKNDPKEYAKGVKYRLKLAKLNSWDKRILQLNSLISACIK